MQTGHFKIAALAGAAALLVPATAGAHISLHPNTTPAGAFATLTVRMPGEQEGAHVTKLDMLFPAGITSVSYENVPGWTVRLVSQKVSPPIQTDEGPVSEQVAHVVWTWRGPLGEVSNNQFIQFPLSFAIPGNLAGQALLFKTVQSYSNGVLVHWIDPSLSAEHPAARINITAKGGVIEDVAGREAGPEAGQTGGAGGTASRRPALATSGDRASKGLGVAALVVGAVALLAALGGLALGRRARRGA